MRPCVVITTYARPDELSLLLDDIEREAPAGGLDVRVYDDATPHVDRALEQRLHERGWTYRRAAANHGKRDWWRWWNTILDELRYLPTDLFWVVQDDMRLCDRFFARSLDLWCGIDDPRKGSLYLHVNERRAALGTTCWTGVPATQAGRVVHCGWVDGNAFICDRRLFDALDWRLEPVPARRWERDEALSSGVGRQISIRAHARALKLYRVEQSLTVHGAASSVMHGGGDHQDTMATYAFVDGDQAAMRRARVRPAVHASVASIAVRERGLRRIVDSLAPQVDRLQVYLNGYPRVPAFLDREGVEVVRSQDSGDRGDAGKFFWTRGGSGYRLLCDDDIDYPDDYVARLIDGIERHGRRAVVGFHGSVLHDRVVDYHRSRTLLHFTKPLGADTVVHVLGTGVAGYHSSAIRVAPEDFPSANMADVWFGVLAQRQGVPLVCLRRPAGWLCDLPGFRQESVYLRSRRRAAAGRAEPSDETRVVRAHGPWLLHGPPLPRVAPARPRPRARRRAWGPPKRPAARRLIQVRVTGPARAATLVLPQHDHITHAVQASGTYYERELLDAIRARGVHGTFVDVGAHYGNHTAYFGLECEAERIVAVEPVPETYAGLLQTVAENRLQDRVVTHRMAVHPSWREVAIAELPTRSRAGAARRSNSGHVGVVPVPAGSDATAAALDDILADVFEIGLIKVDAARLSAEILRSGLRTLRRDRPLVAAEAASAPQRHAVRAVLSPLGYREAGCYCWTPTWLWEPAARA